MPRNGNVLIGPSSDARKVEQGLKFGHEVNLTASFQNAEIFLGENRIAVEIRCSLLKLGEIFDAFQCSLRYE